MDVNGKIKEVKLESGEVGSDRAAKLEYYIDYTIDLTIAPPLHFIETQFPTPTN